MIGITGTDGTGYRWLPPKASAVRDGRLRVIPYGNQRAVRRWMLFNAVLLTAVCVLPISERLGFHGAWHGAFYQVALTAVLVECLLRLPALFVRRTIQVDGPMRFVAVSQHEWVGWSMLGSALVLTMIQARPPLPVAWWNALMLLSLLANLGLAVSPRLSRWLLRRRGEG